MRSGGGPGFGRGFGRPSPYDRPSGGGMRGGGMPQGPYERQRHLHLPLLEVEVINSTNSSVTVQLKTKFV